MNFLINLSKNHVIMSTYEVLGSRAPVACDYGDCEGVAMAFMSKGTTVSPLPFRHPSLLDSEIRIRVEHSGLCQSDIHHARGLWGNELTLPLVTGHEIVGVVEKIGEKVTHLKEGDRVGFGVFRDCCHHCFECRTGEDNLCSDLRYTYEPHFGGYATSFQAKEDFFFKLDDSFPGESAPVFCAGAAVYAPLKRHVLPTHKVGIVGIGGLGHLAIMFARKFGCEVTAISTSTSKEAEARSLGAQNFLNLNDPEQLKRASGSLDFILDTSIKINLGVDFGLVKKRGTCAVVALPDVEHDLGLNLFQMLMNQQTLVGSAVASRLDIMDMVEFIRLNKIKPMVDLYPFADIQLGINSLAYGTPRPPKYRNVVETASFFRTLETRRAKVPDVGKENQKRTHCCELQ
jgi:uncharacterized zinc-type alcohol dehydrogenase-like protein